MIPAGRPFYKMSGSGNDFLVIDARVDPPGSLADADVIGRLCARGTGVGADGIVFLERSDSADVRLAYLNSDGSRAEFCGNATLCTTRLAAELGAGAAAGMTIETDSGLVQARLSDGLPEIDLQPVTDVQARYDQIALEPDESRAGFAIVGVPHLVVRCSDVETVDVVGRGRPLRSDPSFPRGTNVSFVSRAASGAWRMRTYERGVEAETLACGSGAVATGLLLALWGEAEPPVEIETRSGRCLRVRLERQGNGWLPSLAGEGRIVYEGRLAEI